MKLRVLPIVFLALLLNVSARASSYVLEGEVRSISNCKSGFAFIPPPDNPIGEISRCILPTKKISLETLAGQTIKIRASNRAGGNLVIEEYMPKQAVGTTKKGFSDHVISAAGAVGSTADAMQGNPSVGTSEQSANPVQVVPPPAKQSPSAIPSSDSYATGVNSCVRGFFDPAYYNFYSYQNDCGQKINILFLTPGGNGGSMDLESGTHGATGDTPKDLEKLGPFEFYACPYHFVAVDANGQRFNRPVAMFKCAKAGY